MNDNNDIEIKIIDELIYNINNKKYKNNGKLPSENDLADVYKVPRIVARKAYERYLLLKQRYKMDLIKVLVKERCIACIVNLHQVFI